MKDACIEKFTAGRGRVTEQGRTAREQERTAREPPDEQQKRWSALWARGLPQNVREDQAFCTKLGESVKQN